MLRKCGFLTGLLAASPALVAFVSPDWQAQQEGGFPWWAWVLFVAALIVLVVLFWRWFSRRRKDGSAADAEAKALTGACEGPELAATSCVPDNLKRIEGIGPKIAGLLQEASITAFAELAATDVGQLEQILHDASITIADPGTWPEQADLAARGEWDRLRFLQDELKGGRRL